MSLLSQDFHKLGRTLVNPSCLPRFLHISLSILTAIF